MHVDAPTISRFIDQCLVPFWTLLTWLDHPVRSKCTCHSWTSFSHNSSTVLRVVWFSTSASIQRWMAGKCNGSWNFSLCLLWLTSNRNSSLLLSTFSRDNASQILYKKKTWQNWGFYNIWCLQSIQFFEERRTVCIYLFLMIGNELGHLTWELPYFLIR